MTPASTQSPEVLRARWEEAAQERPNQFPSEIARQLGVSEGELQASKIGQGSVRLDSGWVEILGRLHTLGEVKAITRNEYAVLEKNGVYPKFEHFGVHSMFVSEDIDMRISLSEWQLGLAVRSAGKRPGVESRSLQFFCKDGTAVHKIFLLDVSDAAGFNSLVDQFKSADQSAGQSFATEHADPLPASSEVDRPELLQAWSELKDTHEFFGLLQRFRVSRIAAMRLAEGRFTRRVDNGSISELWKQVAHAAVPVMLFIGNKGCLQIHKGALKNIVPAHGWLNIMDRGVEVHLKEEKISDSWIVEKPTADGAIRSLELFDSGGRDILSVFGVRTEGKRQSEAWHDSLNLLTAEWIAG